MEMDNLISASDIFIGADVGTSGCRACAIDSEKNVLASYSVNFPASLPENSNTEHSIHVQSPQHWWQALLDTLEGVIKQVDARQVTAICLDATSGTVLLADGKGTPLTDGIMYNDARAVKEANNLRSVAPVNASAVRSATSGLAKLLWLTQSTTGQSEIKQARYFLHQADWLNGQLTGQWGISDFNNALKTGFDAEQHVWPSWLNQLNIDMSLLPKVIAPGSLLGMLLPEFTERWNCQHPVFVYAGTTDSTASCIATEASQPGEAITALGSTLVLKVISEQPVHAPEYGVYSQPYGNYWLVGGGSNSGGAVLRHFFTDQQMHEFESKLDTGHLLNLKLYPLLGTGERFPVNDPDYQPRLTPRPEKDWQFFQALLEGIADIELSGYQRLHELGAPYPKKVHSTGGGSHNIAWQKIRALKLGIPVSTALQSEAAYGSALLALQGHLDRNNYSNHV